MVPLLVFLPSHEHRTTFFSATQEYEIRAYNLTSASLRVMSSRWLRATCCETLDRAGGFSQHSALCHAPRRNLQ